MLQQATSKFVHVLFGFTVKVSLERLMNAELEQKLVNACKIMFLFSQIHYMYIFCHSA